MEVQDKLVTARKKKTLAYKVKITDRAMKMLETRIHKLCKEVDLLLEKKNDDHNNGSVEELYQHDC